MATNRLQRDQILIRALDLLDSAVLDNKDRPAGTIVSTALSIGWLQEALDLFHKKFPFQAAIKSSALVLTQNASTVALPSDFLLDYKNGIVLAGDEGRLQKRSLDYILKQAVSSGSEGKPLIYTIRGDLIHFSPTADKTYNATLYYYSLPAVLGASTVPTFPDDQILTDYVWLRGQEWHGKIQPGTARAFAEQQIKELQKAGIGSEAEADQIDIDTLSYAAQPVAADAWMGSTVPK